MERTGRTPRLLTWIACATAVAALYFAKVVLIPIALALVIAFLLGPLVSRLQKWHFPRVLSIVAAVLLMGVITGGVGWLVMGQMSDLVAKMPEYRQRIQERVATVRTVFEKPLKEASKTMEDLGNDLAASSQSKAASEPVQTVRVAEAPRGPLETALSAIGPTLDAVLTGAIAMLLAFVVLLGKEDLRDRVIRLFGGGKVLVTTQALDEAAQKVSSYIARLLLLNGMHGTAVGVGLTILGVPNALVWGLMSALLRFIPYAGPWIAAAFPILTSLAVFEGWTQPLLVMGLFALLELVSNNVVEPWIYGKGTGVTPLAVLISTMFWTWIWGPVGLVLATPLTVCFVVMSKHMPDINFLYVLFGDAPALPPPARFYQRLLAGDQDQAWAVLQAELKDKPLHEVYDTVVLPALSLAEVDRQKGQLDAPTEMQVAESMEMLLDEADEATFVASAAAVESSEPGGAPRALCVPARSMNDALASTMLKQILTRDGVRTDVVALEDMPSGVLAELERNPCDVVCISTVPPSRFIHVRYLCKRITNRFPDLPIIVGMWGGEGDAARAPEKLPIPENVQTLRKMVDAPGLVKQLAAARAEHPAVANAERG
jgi:predicted PurR-regulated permease PerM